jgi:hypothetical protein
MKRYVLLIAGICLATSPTASLTADRSCAADFCPQTSSAWTIFPDSNPGAPDFWWKPDAVEVEEICICAHGIQFLFTTTQDGEQRPTALVFPKPSPEMLAERLNLEPGSEKLQKEFTHFQSRYLCLLKGLERISGGVVVEGTEMHFDHSGSSADPTIVPNRRLALCWGGEELKLRGYLDVYFGDPLMVLASHGTDCGRLGEVGGIPEGISLTSPSRFPSTQLFLRVHPNPGRTGQYTVSFGLPARGPVELEVFNVAGRRVATLLSGLQEAGRQRHRWSGQTSAGRLISHGVYFVRLSTSEGCQSEKLVHLGP